MVCQNPFLISNTLSSVIFFIFLFHNRCLLSLNLLTITVCNSLWFLSISLLLLDLNLHNFQFYSSSIHPKMRSPGNRAGLTQNDNKNGKWGRVSLIIVTSRIPFFILIILFLHIYKSTPPVSSITFFMFWWVSKICKGLRPQ